MDFGDDRKGPDFVFCNAGHGRAFEREAKSKGVRPGATRHMYYRCAVNGVFVPSIDIKSGSYLEWMRAGQPIPACDDWGEINLNELVKSEAKGRFEFEKSMIVV